MESKENLDISSSSGLDIAPLVYETYYNRIGATEVAPPTPRFALAAQRERERERGRERELQELQKAPAKSVMAEKVNQAIRSLRLSVGSTVSVGKVSVS